MITGKLVDAAGKPRDPFITGYATMNEAYLALQEPWPVVTERNHNSMTLADQQGCRLILQEIKGDNSLYAWPNVKADYNNLGQVFGNQDLCMDFGRSEERRVGKECRL